MDKVLPWIKNHILLTVLASFATVIVGAILSAATIFSDALETKHIEWVSYEIVETDMFIDSLVNKLSEKGIEPMPEGYKQKMKTGIDFIGYADSIQRFLINYTEYQKGVNHLLLQNCDTFSYRDKVLYKDCIGVVWVEYNNYIYQAHPVGKVWIIYLFQWQLPPGARNDITL